MLLRTGFTENMDTVGACFHYDQTIAYLYYYETYLCIAPGEKNTLQSSDYGLLSWHVMKTTQLQCVRDSRNGPMCRHRHTFITGAFNTIHCL
jgi:hypothetical protein